MKGAQKRSVTVVYTGEGKGKTTAGLGLMCRALGNGSRVAFVQFIKNWEVSEDRFLQRIGLLYGPQLVVRKGGRGFFCAGEMSARNVSEKEHIKSARSTFHFALECAQSGNYQLVICDEINNAVHDGLLTVNDVRMLMASKYKTTSLCLTGRYFPSECQDLADIITRMDKIYHHYDDGFIANKGIDY